MTTQEQPQPAPPPPQEAPSFAPLNTPMELRCDACGKKGEYEIGTLFLDPEIPFADDLRLLDKAFSVTKYFRCQHCNAGGPWHLTKQSILLIQTLLIESSRSQQPRIHLRRVALFDGTPTRWPTDGEIYMLGLIDKSPTDSLLWARLGNLYKAGGLLDKAVDSFARALSLDPKDVETFFVLGEALLLQRKYGEAVGCYHRVLLEASSASPRLPKELVRAIVLQSLKILHLIHVKSDRKTPFLPPLQDEQGRALNFAKDPETEQDWNALVEFWMTVVLRQATPAPKQTAAPAPKQPAPTAAKQPAPPAPKQPAPAPKQPASAAPAREPAVKPEPEPVATVGRNDPCPCGSGKKHKKCCMML